MRFVGLMHCSDELLLTSNRAPLDLMHCSEEVLLTSNGALQRHVKTQHEVITSSLVVSSLVLWRDLGGRRSHRGGPNRFRRGLGWMRQP